MKQLIRMSICALACHAGMAQAGPRPAWISELPADSAHVYAVGMASLAGSEADALAAAGEAAKVELLTMLRANVQSTQQSKSTLTVQRKGDKEKSGFREEAEKKTTITTGARDLPGLKVGETHVDRSGDAVYALAVLDLAAAGGEINRRRELVASGMDDLKAKSSPTLADFGEADRLLQGNAPALELAALLSSRLARQGAALEDADRELRKLLVERKKSITFGMDKESASGFDTTALRAAVTGSGYSWSRSPRYSFVLETHLDPEADFTYNRYVIRGKADLQMLDDNGSVIRSSKIAGQGAGSSPARARNALQRHIDEEVVAAVQAWLGGAETADGENPAADAASTATGSAADEDAHGAPTPGSDERPVNWGTP